MNPKEIELKLITKNREYIKLYAHLIRLRSDLVTANKNIINQGKKHEYQCNCNVLVGMTNIIDRLPKP